MYYLNKIVWFFVNPAIIPLVLGAAAIIWRKRWLGWVAIGFLWFASTVTCMCMLGVPLEKPYVATQSVESLPCADAIVLLGGGIGKVDDMEYPDMFEAADRVWHAARLWKAGKAPVVVVTGRNDLAAAVPLLVDLGVSRDAIVVDNESRNTYENSRFTERLLKERAGAAGGGRKVLLVTSAWHMTRALGNFSRTELVAVPAAADFIAFNAYRGTTNLFDWIVPSADTFVRSTYFYKEWIGRLARK